ncbi:hypothetical protein M3Y96_01127000 [Aphelenchoides besseyi]|nr:hypothetical protein M3Y96_01127000 [Aphelenchoides besseyi]
MEDFHIDLDFNWNNDFDNAKALAVEVVEDPIPEPLVPAQKAEHVTSTFVSARKRLAKNEHFKFNAERSVLEEELAKKEMVLETKCPKFSIIVPTQPRSVSPPFIKRSLSPPQTPKAWVSRVSMGKSNMIFDDMSLNTSFASSGGTDITANTKMTTISSTSTGTQLSTPRVSRSRRKVLSTPRSSTKSKIQKEVKRQKYSTSKKALIQNDHRMLQVHLASSRHSRPSERSTNESELNDESVEGTNFNNSKTSTPPMFKAVSIERDIAIKYDDLSSAIHTQKVDNMINLFNKTLDECRRNKGRYWLLLEQPMSGVNTEVCAKKRAFVTLLPLEFRIELLPEILFKCNFDRCQITHVVLNATDSLVTVFDTYEIKCSDILSTALPKCVKILMKKLPTTFNSLGILTVPVLPRFESSNKKMNETLMDILIKSRKEINYVRKVRLLIFEESSNQQAINRAFESLPRLLHKFFNNETAIFHRLKPYDDVAKPAELTYDVNSNRNEERGFRQRRRKYNRFDLPDRWSDYSAIGKVIPDARIIAFKTPLKSDFYETNNVDHFEVTDLLDKIKEFGGELGLVVDLTYTSKYYDPEQFTSHGILHKKIFCHGRDFEKLETSGTEFVEVLKDFFKENSNNNKWVGVHCTHGINRTGYLICRYLTESLGWSFEKALKEFEQARGHSIERIEYLETLRKFAALSTEDEAHKC